MIVTWGSGCAVFIAGGLLQWVEFRATPPSVKEALNCNPQGCISFYEALYFMIVTVRILIWHPM